MFIQMLLMFVPDCVIDIKSALVQVMAWRRNCDRPLPEAMITQFTDAYMCHHALMSNDRVRYMQ